MVIIMLNEEILSFFYEKNLEKIEKNIQREYHRRIKQINKKKEEEKNNIKLSIIGELYYKEGIKDGVNYIIKLLTPKE